ncbi:basic leucine zipper 6-like [Punica granatum]|uniref:BZIP domain-containing protein n=2 Tax=Punica granatum TaxID=22663 RepID=A0A218XAR4_PUNGR|nr:basic leucine zipper 6-like [Punica granatum]OWM81432.1 hypothetical protein CDL15_Pgr007470 [Punica granatum]PKI56255.1 hypothetical protein CRG98_023274 [Punica granatum]
MAQQPSFQDMSAAVSWPSSALLPHQRSPPHLQPSWVDDFLEFSALRRGAHRRSASDSVAFFEAVPELPDSSDGVFERLDNEQLISMFSNELSGGAPPTLLSNPSTPSSDQNSNNEEKAAEPMQPPEVDSPAAQPAADATPAATATSNNDDIIIDPKRVKRILANRQSAQRSRVRKLQYISELEQSVTTLQTEVSALSPRVAFLDHQRLILNVDNSALKQRIAALAQDKIFKDAHQEALKNEIERLRQVYNHQKINLEKMRATESGYEAPPLLRRTTTVDHQGHTDNGNVPADKKRLM